MRTLIAAAEPDEPPRPSARRTLAAPYLAVQWQHGTTFAGTVAATSTTASTTVTLSCRSA